ncbi:MAG: hypothetical protein QHC79_25510 [Pseudosphingobacterium sp.]|nr:hypothetical protein [Pseudosphingobacterium sp.]
MKALIPIFVFLFCAKLSLAQNSPDLDKASRAIKSLELKNQMLEQKVELLDSANDKILSATYAMIAIILGLGIWNTIQSYRINNERLLSIKKGLSEELNGEIRQSVEKTTGAIKSAIESQLTGQMTRIVYNEILLTKMTCCSIEERDYRDINGEAFCLVKLVNASSEYYQLSGVDRPLKDSFNYVLKYLEKYPGSVKSEGYETEVLRETIENIKVPTLNLLKSKIMEKVS